VPRYINLFTVISTNLQLTAMTLSWHETSSLCPHRINRLDYREIRSYSVGSHVAGIIFADIFIEFV